VLAIAWALRQARRLSSRELLSGVTEAATAGDKSPGRLSRRIATICLPLALLLLVVSLAGLVPASEAFGGFSWQVVAFFLCGVAALTGSLALLAAWLSSDRTAAVRGTGPAAVARLALRNAARHRTRSVLTASLIASAAFVLVAIAAGQRNPVDEAPVRDSGNGGFVLVAESSMPVLYDLNTPDGRTKLGFRAEEPEAQRLAEEMHVTPFRVRSGEDASCLNLYATRLPTILGVPDDVIAAFDDEGRFKFADTPAEHPWRLLREQLPEGRIPVLGDMNTVMYSLHLGIGGEVDVPKETLTDAGIDGATLQIAGMLDGSIFQGVLLMSEANFHRLFPRQAGFRYFLIEAPLDDADALAGLLESQLSDSGFDAERVSRRLQDFLAVQNTYLLTFQSLGGLGLLLGTIGLATVMLRNVLERRSELALLRAVGLTRSSVSLLVLVENAFLLACGLTAGTLSALLAMTPHLASTGAQVPWLSLQLLVGGVFLVGMLAALAAVREAVRTPILATLRAE
jgi:putative ABC transport system permease protein